MNAARVKYLAVQQRCRLDGAVPYLIYILLSATATFDVVCIESRLILFSYEMCSIVFGGNTLFLMKCF